MPTTPYITRAFQWDLARQVERLDFLLKWLPRYAGWGYEELYIHLEDAVEYPSLPGVARSDAYSYGQFARLVEAATAAGIRVVPIVNLLGHTQYLIKTPELRDLNELRDASGQPLDRGQICPLHPRTLETAGNLLRDMAPFCTAGKVHVGLDESFLLGRCPRCRADIDRVGLAAHFAAHVGQLDRLTNSLGLRMGMWADMLALLPAAIPLLPRDVIAYDWYYYPFTRHPRVELRNFAEVDLATPLQARGIEYWGCPMNGAFRYEPLPVFGERLANILSWWRRCRRVGAGGFLVTSWEANRLAIELATAVDAAAACLWLDPGVEDPREMLARGFARVFGGTSIRSCRAASSAVATGLWRDRPDAATIPESRRGPAAFAQGYGEPSRPRPTYMVGWRRLSRVALAGDEYAFAGYHRWQINDRWDACADRAGIAPYENELNAVQGLCRSLLAHSTGSTSSPQAGSYKCPPALAASIAFRLYLAQRDVFVRRAAAAVFQLRRTGSTGLRPASGPSRRSETGAALASLRTEASAFAAAIRAGRTAARAMWRRSRDPRVRGPNELMLDRDAGRLRDWRRWLGRVERNPEIVWQATPVCGAWQLLFTVHNFAPAMQKVVVEQQQADGSWVELFGLHIIEFRASAARPLAGIRREFSVPVRLDAIAGAENAEMLKAERLKTKGGGAISRSSPISVWPASLAGARGPGSIALRLAVRGIGQVAVSNIDLTDGIVILHPRGWPPRREKTLGRPAPRRGFPRIEETRSSCVRLAFLA